MAERDDKDTKKGDSDRKSELLREHKSLHNQKPGEPSKNAYMPEKPRPKPPVKK